MMGARRTAIFVGLVVCGPLAATIALVVSWHDLSGNLVDLYAPMPGSDDRTAGALAFVWLPFTWMYAAAALIGRVVWATGRHRKGARAAMSLGAYFGALYGFLILRSVLVDVMDVQADWWQLILILLAALTVAAMVAKLMPRSGAYGPAPESRLALSPAVRVSWSGAARGRWSPLILAATVGAAIVSVFVWPALTAAFALLALFPLRSLRVVTRVSDRGVRITSGRLDWTAGDIALAEILSARVEQHPVRDGLLTRRLEGVGELDPRSRLLRPGDQLIVQTSEGAVVISVDDAQEAADVINALVARERARTTLASDARHP